MVLESDPTAHAELLAVRDAARRLKTRDLSDCDVFLNRNALPDVPGRTLLGPRPPLSQREHARRRRGSESRMLTVTAVCNLCSLTPKRDHIGSFFRVGAQSDAGLPPLNAIFPNYNAPIVRRAADGEPRSSS